MTLNKALGNGNLEDGANLGSGEVRGYSGPNVGHGSALDGLDERGNIAVKRREVGETLRIIGLADGRLAVVERVELGSSLLDDSGGVIAEDSGEGVNVGVGDGGEERLVGEVSHGSTFLFEKLWW